MSGGDLPPRQKMIGMMYLVLTALLAMNVSKDILDAFIVVNGGIENSTATFSDKTELYYRAFASAATESAAAKPFKEKADKVKKMSDELYTYIGDLKKHLIMKTDKLPENAPDSLFLIKNVSSKDNYDIPTLEMGLAEPGKLKDGERSAVELRTKINSFQKTLIGLFKENKEAQDQIKQSLAVLNTEEAANTDGKMESWEVHNFYHVPLAAVVTILSKVQSDVRSAEAEAVAKLYENIDAGSVSFNKVDGFAYAKKAYVLEGDSFAASVFTAAYDDRQNPDIFVGNYDSALVAKGETDENKIMKGDKGEAWKDFKNGGWYQLKSVEDGKGFLKIRESVGVHEWGGIIKVKTKKGPKIYPFNTSFEVGRPSTTVSAEKMNVFYIGVDNPVSVSAPMPNFKASAPGLRPGKGQGQYIMKPTKPGKVNVIVTGIGDDGKSVSLGKKEFRVKRIPDPKSYCAGKSGSASIKKAAFMAASTVQAKMENFDFDIRVKVKSFTFSTTKAGIIQEIKVSGNRLNEQCKRMIKKAKRNQRFFIEDIKAGMPDGSTRKLAPVNFKTI